jgi:hypothetical protein
MLLGTILTVIDVLQNASTTQGAAYRPPQWSSSTMVKTNLEDSEDTLWFFDATFNETHDTSLKITEHPVQTGANITDHAYMQPARVVLSIGMSDAMDSYTPGQWGIQQGKSINAYQQLLGWQKNRIVLTLNTNLNTYSNMIIENISAPRDSKTLYSLKATVTLRQLIIASTAQVTVASDTTTTQTTTTPKTAGNVQTTTVDTAPGTSEEKQSAENSQTTSLADQFENPGQQGTLLDDGTWAYAPVYPPLAD